LGNLNVLGYSIEEIKDEIEKKLLEDYFKKEARLFVNVKLAGLRYTVNGEVGSPGTIVLFQDKVNIMEAIANSGDITITGNRKEVQVIRKFPQGFETYYVDLTSSKAFESPAFYIQPNDYIYVKPLRQKSWGTGVTGIQTIGTIITALSLITTTILLTRNL
ncbi:MAG: sugar transporter, partial [Flavobacterium sp.]